MPIDPAIATSVPLKIPDPQEQMNAMLRNQYLAQEISKARREQDDSDAYSSAIKNAMNENGTVNQPMAAKNLASAGQGKQIAKFQTSMAELAKMVAEVDLTRAKTVQSAADAGKADTESLAKAVDVGSKLTEHLSTDPKLGAQQYLAAARTFHSIPAVQKIYGEYDPANDVAEVQKALATPEGWAQFRLNKVLSMKDLSEKVTTHVFQGNQHTLLSTNKYGAPNPEVAAVLKEGINPNVHPAVTNVDIHMPANVAETAYARTKGEAEAKRDIGLEEMAASAPAYATNVDRMRTLLRSGKVITGAGSDWELNAKRVLQKFGQKGYEEALNATQEYDKLASGQVLDQAMARNKAGLGMRTSVAELNMIRDASVRKGMEPGAQLAILDKMYNDFQDAAPKSNHRLGEVNASPKLAPVNKTLAVHPAPAVGPGHGAWPTPPQVNIDRLRANPGEAAIFESHYGPGSAAKYGVK